MDEMRGVFCLACALVAALPALTRAATAGDVMTTAAGKAVHWEGAEIGVSADSAFVSRNVPAPAVELAIEEAAAAWNAQPEMKVRLVRRKDPAAADVKIRFCRTGWRRASSLLGHTEFEAELTTGVVNSAVIEINECNFQFVGPEDVAEGHVDLQAVLTHELGHVLGLGHSQDPAAVMFTGTGSVRQRRPNDGDREALAAIYGIAHQRPPKSEAVERPPSSRRETPAYAGGKEEPLPFELPWPADAGKSAARFVPTVLPLERRASTASDQHDRMPSADPRASVRPAPIRREPRRRRPIPKAGAPRPTRRAGGEAPVPIELPWPG